MFKENGTGDCCFKGVRALSSAPVPAPASSYHPPSPSHLFLFSPLLSVFLASVLETSRRGLVNGGHVESRPHTTGGAGDVDAAGADLRFFLWNLRILHSRACRELLIELLPIEIARLDFENGVGYEFGLVFALRESSWAGALAPARLTGNREHHRQVPFKWTRKDCF